MHRVCAVTNVQLTLAELCAVTILPWTLWHVLAMRRIVPRVLVQIACGIVLGPSVLGRIAPGLQSDLFGAAQWPFLSGVATLGLLLFGFVTGLHVDLRASTRQTWAFAATCAGSFVVPGLLGAAVGVWLLEHVPRSPVAASHPWVFVAAIASCCAVTALPVLAAILRELRLLHTQVGQCSLALAAANDLALWTVLGIVLSIVAANRLPVSPVAGFAILLALVAAAQLAGKPLLRRVLQLTEGGSLPREADLVVVLTATLSCSFVTETLGFHPLFGAFVAGLVLPREHAKRVLEQLEPLTVTVLLPFFFVTTGLKTSLDFPAAGLLQIVLVSALACMAGKLLGTALPARMLGLRWREATALGVAMQTKGLMEIVVLTVLRDSRIIDDQVFSAFVLMALLTTLATKPLLHWLQGSPAAAVIPSGGYTAMGAE
jgi:Kef-type K+ transport system membrane component KefB